MEVFGDGSVVVGFVVGGGGLGVWGVGGGVGRWVMGRGRVRGAEMW